MHLTQDNSSFALVSRVLEFVVRHTFPHAIVYLLDALGSPQFIALRHAVGRRVSALCRRPAAKDSKIYCGLFCCPNIRRDSIFYIDAYCLVLRAVASGDLQASVFISDQPVIYPAGADSRTTTDHPLAGIGVFSMVYVYFFSVAVYIEQMALALLAANLFNRRVCDVVECL